MVLIRVKINKDDINPADLRGGRRGVGQGPLRPPLAGLRLVQRFVRLHPDKDFLPLLIEEQAMGRRNRVLRLTKTLSPSLRAGLLGIAAASCIAAQAVAADYPLAPAAVRFRDCLVEPAEQADLSPREAGILKSVVGADGKSTQVDAGPDRHATGRHQGPGGVAGCQGQACCRPDEGRRRHQHPILQGGGPDGQESTCDSSKKRQPTTCLARCPRPRSTSWN